MIIYVNPPCNVISHALHQIWMASSEGRVAALVTEGVSSSAEGELAIDETTSTVSLAPNVCVVPGVSAVVGESEECVGVLENFQVLLLERRVLHVLLKEKQMTMIVSWTLSAG